MRKIMTLVLIEQERKVLLGYKKRGFGVDKWNGFGGKVECGESVTEAAMRELEEECGIIGNQPIFLSLIEFIMGDREFVVHVFKLTNYLGNIKETDEMKPQWFDINDIPYDKMWEDDQYWFPLFFKTQFFYAKFNFVGEALSDWNIQKLNYDQLLQLQKIKTEVKLN